MVTNRIAVRTYSPFDGRTRKITPSKNRIWDLEQVRKYIDKLDFTALTKNLMEGGFPWEYVWPREHVAQAEEMYRKWLFLQRKHEGEPLPPTADIDGFWHAHILDTYFYSEACDHIFGYYFHHFPYFGIRGEEDARALRLAFEHTMSYYSAEYDEPMYEYDFAKG